MDKIEVIGVISGTSLVGLDLCHVIFNLENLSDFKIANSISISYPSNISKKLNNIVEKKSDEIYHNHLVKDFVGIEKIISEYL